MKLYRQRPVIVEAEMYDGTHASAAKIVEWVKDDIYLDNYPDGTHGLYLDEGDFDRPVIAGEYVVRNTEGFFEVYAPDTFGANFEPVLEL